MAPRRNGLNIIIIIITRRELLGHNQDRYAACWHISHHS
jgi:hypothetical protein